MAIIVDQDLCRGCGSCLKACSNNAISLKDNKAFIDQTKCTSCQKCVEVCKTGALQFARTAMPEIGEKSTSIVSSNPQVTYVSVPNQSGYGKTTIGFTDKRVLSPLVDYLAAFLMQCFSPLVPKRTLSNNHLFGFHPHRRRKQRRGRFSTY